MDDIEDRLQNQRHSTDPTILTLYGLGGIGKSQIAREYSYRRKDIYRHGAVLWISSETTVMVDHSFLHAAYLMKLDATSEKERLRNKIAVLEMLESQGMYTIHDAGVQMWLSDQKRGPIPGCF
jgi:hypothetical protein